MTSQRIAQTNQQQKSETSKGSGILQRASVRSVADAEVQATDDNETLAFSHSAFAKDLSQVPISTTKPHPFHGRKTQGHPRPTIQAKMTIGKPKDRYEQEADRVAAEVVQRINAPVSAGQSVQRQEEAEAEIQTKPEITALQRRYESQEGLQEAIAGEDASTGLENAITSARGSGQPIDAGLQQSMGQAMGADFSGVKVHTDDQADQLNRSIQARAFTTGQDVFFRQGEYNPGSRGGQELLAHELTHVVQQGGTSTSNVQRVKIESNQIEAARISQTIQEITGKQNVPIEVEVLQARPLLKLYFHTNGKFSDYSDTEEEYKEYKEFTPVAFCERQTGTIYINEAEFANESNINYEKLNAVLVHESQHSASFNHKGFQEREDIINDPFTLDEATTDYFAMLTYTNMYPDKDYKDFTNYYKNKQNKKTDEWQGNALMEMIEAKYFTKEDLKKAYYEGDEKAINKIKNNAENIQKILSKYKSE